MFRYTLLLLITLSTFSIAAAELKTGERETIGLVLAGGGARGIAHVGVIRALEEMQVPIDAVAGTSMGALVGGLYASGMSADDLYQVVTTMDWDLAFEDAVDRGELPPRRKSDDYDFPSDLNFAFKDGKLSIPLGLIQGQQVRQIIKELMLDVVHVRDFDQLPIPFRAVAADIESGDAYVFSQGDVVTAMRASMSLPGLLAPVEHDGRLLVDGGVANNIPVDVARAMGVDRLIVVDIGTPLLKRDEINSVVSVAEQMVGFLTRKNSVAQLETLGDSDVLITPDLQGMGMLAFDEDIAIYQRGYDAAISDRSQIAALSLPKQQWEEHMASRMIPQRIVAPIEFIAIKNDSGVSDEMIRVQLEQPLGEPLDRGLLNDNIASIYALDHWEIIDYQVTTDERGTGLLVDARAKSWGGDKLKFGLGLITDLDGSSDFNLGASYLRKGVNERGGEVYSRAQVGDTVIFSGQFYQPLDLRSRYFVVPYASYTDNQVYTLGPEYDADDVVGAWRVKRLEAELAIGANVFSSTQLRLGTNVARGEYEVDIAVSNDLTEDDFREGSVFASARYDTLDRAFFPTQGNFLYVDYEAQRTGLGSDASFERWMAIGQSAFSFGGEKRNTVIFTARTGQSIDAPNTPQNYFQLGGLFNVSGVAQNFFSGRQMAFVMGQYQRKLTANSVIPINLPVYAGFSVEGGRLWQDRSDVDLGDLTAGGSVYLGIDSPIGPMYLAYGRTEDDLNALYLSLGWPFLSNLNRLGR
ncbi:MAG: patatin-like phospholipase family protein [Halioglobus sp.]